MKCTRRTSQELQIWHQTEKKKKIVEMIKNYSYRKD